MSTPQTSPEKSNEQKLAGVLGFFDDAHSLIEGTRKVRDAKYRYFDAFTPYPVHGLDAAQGLKRSPIPYVTLAAGLTGFMIALGFQYWTSAVDWPLNVGGKPFFSWPAFVPIVFELTVLLGGLATAGAMFALNGLPNTKRKIFDPSLTSDRFAVVIEAPPAELDEDPEGGEEDPKAKHFKPFDVREAAEFLKQAGAKEVRTVYQQGWF